MKTLSAALLVLLSTAPALAQSTAEALDLSLPASATHAKDPPGTWYGDRQREGAFEKDTDARLWTHTQILELGRQLARPLPQCAVGQVVGAAIGTGQRDRDPVATLPCAIERKAVQSRPLGPVGLRAPPRGEHGGAFGGCQHGHGGQGLVGQLRELPEQVDEASSNSRRSLS